MNDLQKKWETEQRAVGLDNLSKFLSSAATSSVHCVNMATCFSTFKKRPELTLQP